MSESFKTVLSILYTPLVQERSIGKLRSIEENKLKGQAQRLQWPERNSASNAKTLGSGTAVDGEFVFLTTAKASKMGLPMNDAQEVDLQQQTFLHPKKTVAGTYLC